MRSKIGREALAAHKTNRVAEALDSLSQGEVGLGHSNGPEKPNAGQRVAANYLIDVGDMACRRKYFSEEAVVPGEEPWYGATVQNQFIWLSPNKVSLPGEAVAGSADMLSLLPGSLRCRYEAPKQLLRDGTCVEKAPFRAFCGVQKGRYAELVGKLSEVGILLLQKNKPKIINGIFGVPKGDKQRLIIDARNANTIFKEPPTVNLPTPGDLSELIIEKGHVLVVAKSDMDNFYHRLCMPVWLRQYFGLPKVTIEGVDWWPIVRVLPMGWSHSVYIGQEVHETVLKRAGIPESTRVQNNRDRMVGKFRHGAYVDDYFSLGTDSEEAWSALSRVVETCGEMELPAKSGKILEPGLREFTEVIGIEVHEDGVLRPSQEKIRKLIRETRGLVKRRKWEIKYIQHIVGKWAWTLLLRRPFFSVLGRVYKHLEEGERVFKPTLQARKEMETLIDIAPLLETRLDLPFSDTVVCTDASEKGGGVSYCRAKPAEVRDLVHFEREEMDKWVKDQNWVDSVSHKWTRKVYIHLLEGEALVLGLKWLLRAKKNYGKRLVIFVDNQTLLGALKKGRSSKKSLNKICRKVAALVGASNCKLELFYIKSELNPADKPSRYFS